MVDMRLKLIAFGIVILFFITTLSYSTSASFFRKNNADYIISSLAKQKVRGIILRSYVIGNATGGKQVGRVALIDFTKVEFKTIRLFPPGIGYVSYENVSVLIFGLKSEISDGSFYLNTKADKDKVSSIIFK